MKIYLLYFSLVTILLPSFLAGQADMIVHPGTKITVGAQTTLDIGGNQLLLEDDFLNAPSFLQYGDITFSGGGKSYVEQYLNKDAWHMVSMPVENEVIGVYLWNYLEQFNESDGNWSFLTLPLTIPLNSGKGYFVWNYTVDPNGQWPASPDSAVFSGTLNKNSINLVLSNTDASPSSGWNLIGNPFPVAIEWNGHPDWNLNNVSGTMYIYDQTYSSGNYVTWNYELGIGSNPNGGYIAATQGFWVRAADTSGTPASLTIPASQRSHNPAVFLKNGQETVPNQLMLTVSDDLQKDHTIIGFYDKATSGYDPAFDGMYFKPGFGSLSLYSVFEGIRYSLDELPSIEDQKIIPVGFEAFRDGIHTITAEWIESFPEEIPIYLEDKNENILYNLRFSNTYSFTAYKNDSPDRFVIHFGYPSNINSIIDYVSIYSWGKEVHVDIPFEVNGEIQIFDLMGRGVATSEVHSGHNIIPLNKDTGPYFIRLVSDRGMVTKKVHIQ